MTAPLLSSRQQQLADFLAEFHARKGYPPTLAQMAEHLGLSSLNSVRSLLAALQKKGCLEWDPGVSRGIRLKGWERMVAVTAAKVQGRHGHEHTAGSIRYWLGWYTRDRRPVFHDPAWVALFRDMADSVCGEHGWRLERLDLQPTRVRLAVVVDPDHSPLTVAHHFRRDSLGERLRARLGQQPLADLWDHGIAVGNDENALAAALDELERTRSETEPAAE